MEYVKRQQRKINPRENANIFSVLSFFYTLDIFRKGAKKDLQQNDLYEVLTDFHSKKLGDQLEEEWERQKKHRKNLSIIRLLVSCYGKRYLLLGIVQFFCRTALILIQPRALAKLISYFDPTQTELTKEDVYFYAAVLIAVTFCNCMYMHNYFFTVTALGIQIRTAFCSFIYRKALKLSPSRLGDISVGKIVTLLTKDVLIFEGFVLFANDLWIAVVKTIVIFYVIYDRVGIATVVGVGVLFLALPLQMYLGTWAARMRMKMCKRTDERLQITQETLSAIRIIKMYTWELFFENKVAAARRKEIQSMHKIFYLKCIVLQMGALSSKIAFYLLIMTYIWLGNHINAEIVYFILTCFQILTHAMAVHFPHGIAYLAEMLTSIKRIGNVLKALEVESVPLPDDIKIKPKVLFKNVTVNIKENKILKTIDLQVETGVTLITGPVGSGKSFLLKTILRDYEPTEGSVLTHGRISYASQEPWLFPSSIKQNIIFGEAYDDSRYQEVLNVCALRYDFELLSAGDNTIVEDRGINLSKGQQARINLARAVYKDSDIYLLDDCLSALDAHVSDFIFHQCVKDFLKDKLVILVTHNTKHLKEVDNVVVMRNGCIKSIKKGSEIDVNEITEEIKEKEAQEEEIEKDNENCNIEDCNETDKLITETTTEKKVYHEESKEGGVDWNVYKIYIGFGGGFIIFILMFGVFILAQLVSSFTDKLVSKWVNLEQTISNYSIYNATNFTEYEEIIDKRNTMLNWYSIMIVLTVAFNFARAFSLFAFAQSASIKLHKYMITNIVNATMTFFDTNFIGNILNRFSKDLTTIDEQLPFVFYEVFRVFLIFVGIIILIATVIPSFLIPASIFCVVLIIIRTYYLPTGRSLRRLDASTRSPVIGHLNATLEGLTTIRAFKAESILRDEFDKHQDLYTSASYSFQCCMRAFAFILDFLCSFFISWIVIRFVINDDVFLAGSVGLAITQAFHLTGTLQWGIRQWAEIENQMTSVERVLEYTEVKQELKQGQDIENWPTEGEVIYENVYLAYTNSTEYVLKNINFIIKPKQKIGIVGRTGAGKSSIISTLYRLYEVEGKILIDGVNIRTLSLEFLRSKISIIPQDPVLFTGTVRDNIDPRREYSDDEIWKAIEAAHLKKIVPSLDFEITENGANFSVGQRQLICMARAITRNNKIIVLDEATANMDVETDALIQETIAKNFASCTVFVIAHKLHTILNSHRVIVMDKGEIIENDEPKALLENKDGIFYKMVLKSELL